MKSNLSFLSFIMVLCLMSPASAMERSVLENLVLHAEGKSPVVDRVVSATSPNKAVAQSYIYHRSEKGLLTMIITDGKPFSITKVSGNLTVDQILSCFGRQDIDAQESGLMFILVGDVWTKVIFSSESESRKRTVTQYMCE